MCPIKGGLLKPALDGQGWAHLVCLLWTPGSGLDHSLSPASINVPESSGAACEICNSTYGVMRSCADPTCLVQLHPMCAKRQGYAFHESGISCAAHQPATKGLRKKAKRDASGSQAAFKDGLPPAKMPYEQLMRDVSQAMDDRGTSQSELCRSLSLSPVSLSLWRRNKPLSPRTRDLYSAALELWLADPGFELSDPKLTNTAPNSVRRMATARLSPAASCRLSPAASCRLVCPPSPPWRHASTMHLPCI